MSANFTDIGRGPAGVDLCVAADSPNRTPAAPAGTPRAEPPPPVRPRPSLATLRCVVSARPAARPPQSGQAAAPPSSVMNSRRLMSNTGSPSAVGPPHAQPATGVHTVESYGLEPENRSKSRCYTSGRGPLWVAKLGPSVAPAPMPGLPPLSRPPRTNEARRRRVAHRLHRTSRVTLLILPVNRVSAPMPMP